MRSTIAALFTAHWYLCSAPGTSSSAGVWPAFPIPQNPSPRAPKLVVLPAPTSCSATDLELFIEFAGFSTAANTTGIQIKPAALLRDSSLNNTCRVEMAWDLHRARQGFSYRAGQAITGKNKRRRQIPLHPQSKPQSSLLLDLPSWTHTPPECISQTILPQVLSAPPLVSLHLPITSSSLNHKWQRHLLKHYPVTHYPELGWNFSPF